MKRYFVFIVFSFGLITSLMSQTADERIGSLLNSQDFFRLQRDYSLAKDEVSEPLDLITEALLGSYFNRPAEANEKIAELLTNHIEQIGGNVLPYATLMAINYYQMYNYGAAASIFEQLVGQLTGVADEETVKSYTESYSHYKALAGVPPQTLEYPDKQAVIPFTLDKIGLMNAQVKHDNAGRNFVLDFGAGLSMIETQFVEEFGIQLLADSTMTVGGTGFSAHTQLGIAPELTIGDITLKNVVFIVSDNIIPDTIPEWDYQIDGIIGMPVLTAMEKLRFSHSDLTISRAEEEKDIIPNLVLINNKLFVNASTSGEDIIMVYDSGGEKSMLYSDYLRKGLEDIEYLEQDSIGLGSFGGIIKVKTYKKPDFTFRIGSKDMMLPMIQITEESKPFSLNIPLDGVIGIDVLWLNKAMTIDFKNMYMDFE